jgi:hypothetical protein
MGNDHQGDTKFPADLKELHPHSMAEHGIECGKWLIQQEDGGFLDQRPGQGHSLPLPAGQLVRITAGQVSDLKGRHDLRDLLPLARQQAETPVFFQRIGDILLHGQMRKQGIVLKEISHVALSCRQIGPLAVIKEKLATHRNTTAVRPDQAGNSLDGQTFSRTRGPEDHGQIVMGRKCCLQHKTSVS